MHIIFIFIFICGFLFLIIIMYEGGRCLSHIGINKESHWRNIIFVHYVHTT